jgi:hypothetical protein
MDKCKNCVDLEKALEEATQLYQFMYTNRTYWKDKYVRLASKHYDIPENLVKEKHRELE